MKPKEGSANDVADLFPTTHWIGVLLAAQVLGFPVVLANLYRLGL
jgi:hypothetical protein